MWKIRFLYKTGRRDSIVPRNWKKIRKKYEKIPLCFELFRESEKYELCFELFRKTDKRA